MKKILIIGGITWRDTEHPIIGGTTVLLDNFIDYCIEQGVPHVVIPTNQFFSHFKGVRNILTMTGNLLHHGQRGDVAMVNVSSKVGLITLFPFVYFLSRMLGLQVVCRMFAGSIHHYLDAKSYRKRIALHFLRKTKVSFFETQELLSWFKNNGYTPEWFPNVRRNNSYSVPSTYEKKMVFVAQVYEDKGVDILLRLSNHLPSDYTIDLYGTITDNKYTDNYFSHYRARYKGTLKPDEVTMTLAKYNVMLFPTWWHAEGYPGVIIEALSVGMPVVSTEIGGIPEMIENGISGLLTQIKDEEAFEKAVVSIDQQLYDQLRAEAAKRFELYNSDIVNQRIVNEILR